MSGINIVGPGGILQGTTSDVDVNVNLDGKVFEKAVTNIIHKNHKAI